jgi:hypothetical protein
MKNSNLTIGNQIHDLPARPTVPQPTVPPRAPFISNVLKFKNQFSHLKVNAGSF